MQKKAFFKRLIDLGIMNENGGISLHIKGVKDWPQELDIENWEIDSVSPGDEDDEKGEGYVSGYAGGDWQDMTRFTILIPASGKPYCKLFDSPDYFSGKNIYKELKSLVKEELKEAQFKTKKRKVARSYEERKKLANRKRFNERRFEAQDQDWNMDIDLLKEIFKSYFEDEEVPESVNSVSFKKVGADPNNTRVEIRVPAILGLKRLSITAFIVKLEGAIKTETVVTLKCEELPGYEWESRNDDELFDDIKDLANLADGGE